MSIVIVEGNIGAGKSTLLESLNRDKYNIIDEPLSRFCDFKGINPLSLHNNGLLNSYCFSSYVITSMITELKNKLVKDKTNILSRSAYSAIYCFARLHLEDERMTKNEFILLEALKELYESYLVNFDVYYVLLNTNTSNCLLRLKNRNRSEERTINSSFINRLDTKHIKLVDKKDTPYSKGWDLVIDGNKTAKEINSSFECFLNEKKL